MTTALKPVWVWLPDQSEPVHCGAFSLAGGVGTFHYDDAYKARPDAVQLDEFSLRFTRSRRGLKETRQGGLFGVFRDASPEGFGLALLHAHGRWTLSPAFDIAPYISFSGTLAMAITRDGEFLATTENLLKDCALFGYDRADAAVYIEQARQTFLEAWSEELAAVGYPDDALRRPSWAWLSA